MLLCCDCWLLLFTLDAAMGCSRCSRACAGVDWCCSRACAGRRGSYSHCWWYPCKLSLRLGAVTSGSPKVFKPLGFNVSGAQRHGRIFCSVFDRASHRAANVADRCDAQCSAICAFRIYASAVLRAVGLVLLRLLTVPFPKFEASLDARPEVLSTAFSN